MNSLVSVIIASYNSAHFIEETLDSISQQTWKEIELIITDDCSIDETVRICNIWLDQNQKRFVRVEMVTSEINTGVSANVNRGLYKATGSWIKLLGADDTLFPCCIEDNMLWVNSHPEVRALFSKIDIYRDTFKPENKLGTSPGNPFSTKGIMSPERSADSQYRMLLVSDRIHYSPSVFLHLETVLSIGGFDERFRILEDYPMWLNLTKNGNKLSFMDKITVNYRQHSEAINNTGIQHLINPNYFKSENFRKLYTYPYLPVEIRLAQRFNWFASQIFRFDRLNKSNRPNKLLLDLLTLYLNPFKYIIWLKKRLITGLNENEFYM